jgi:GT2 family glycosyltransferase
MNVYVVIVTYYGIEWVEKCFSSLKQSLIKVKVITIDNGSNDGTKEIILERYPEVDLIQSEVNLGFGKANNIGIRKAYDAGANYVFLLNQDAWIEKDTIQILIDSSLKNLEYGILSPIQLNGEGNGLDRNFSLYISPENCENLYSDKWCNRINDKPYETRFVNAAAWLLTRKCIEIVGGFNPSFYHYGEDDNYIHRLKYHGLKVGICAQAIIYHDRFHRKKNSFLIDQTLIKTRQIRLQLSNPNSNNFKKLLDLNLKKFIKSIIFLRPNFIYSSIKDIFFLIKQWREIRGYVKKSKASGMNFLD